jgi:hypothetical protein
MDGKGTSETRRKQGASHVSSQRIGYGTLQNTVPVQIRLWAYCHPHTLNVISSLIPNMCVCGLHTVCYTYSCTSVWLMWNCVLPFVGYHNVGWCNQCCRFGMIFLVSGSPLLFSWFRIQHKFVLIFLT